jgi:hypothetical protein
MVSNNAPIVGRLYTLAPDQIGFRIRQRWSRKYIPLEAGPYLIVAASRDEEEDFQLDLLDRNAQLLPCCIDTNAFHKIFKLMNTSL